MMLSNIPDSQSACGSVPTRGFFKTMQLILWLCCLFGGLPLAAYDFDASLAAETGTAAFGNRIHYHSYSSTIRSNFNQRYTVALPRNYDANPTQNYDVFYVYDGHMVDDHTGFEILRHHDYLVDQGLIDPLIIVGIQNNNRDQELRVELDTTIDEIINGIIPRVNSDYRTTNNPQTRGIYGHSRGGNAAMHTAWNYSNHFGRCAASAPSMYYTTYLYYSIASDTPASGKRDFQRYYVGGGMRDMTYSRFTVESGRSFVDAGWSFGENFAYHMEDRYSPWLSSHTETCAGQHLRYALHFLYRKQPLEVSAVRIARKNLPTTTVPSTPDRFDISSNSTTVQLDVYYGPYLKLTYPDWTIFSSDDTGVVSLTGETSNAQNDYESVWGRLNPVASGSTLIRASFNGMEATAQVNVNGYTPTGSDPVGAAAGTMGGSNQAPVAGRQIFDVEDGFKLEDTLIGSDPDGDPIAYYIVQSSAGWQEGNASAEPHNGNSFILNASTGSFGYYPAENAFSGRLQCIYSISDGGLESAMGLVTLWNGEDVFAPESSSVTLEMPYQSAEYAESAAITLNDLSTGIDKLVKVSASSDVNWIAPFVLGSIVDINTGEITDTPFWVSIGIDSNANTLPQGQHTGTITLTGNSDIDVMPRLASEDSYILGGANQGDKSVLYVSSSQTAISKWTDLDTIPGTVVRAVLRVYGNFADPMNLYQSDDDSWQEMTVTSSNAPVADQHISTFEATGVTSSRWATVDVTNAIESARTGDGTMTFLITDAGDGSTQWVESRESDDSAPELIIYYEGATRANPPTTTISVTLNIGDAPLEIPTNFSASAPAYNQVNLSWLDNTSEETKYILQRKPQTLPAESIVDNTDTANTVATGTWPSSTTHAGFYDSDYQHDGNANQGSLSFRWNKPDAELGVYEVYMRYSSASTRATNIPLTIQHTGGTASSTLDQTVNGGIWNLLGTYTLDGSSYVEINNTGTDGFVCADAVKFVPADSYIDLVDLSANSTSYTDTSTLAEKSYTYRLRAENATRFSGWVYRTVTTPSQAGISNDYTNWSNSIGWNTADNTQLGDPDGDSLSNLVEYALGKDPLTFNTAFTTGTTQINGSDYITLTFIKNKLAQDIEFHVETAESLTGSWTAVHSWGIGTNASNATNVQITAEDSQQQTIQVNIPMTTTKFVRLKIIKP